MSPLPTDRSPPIPDEATADPVVMRACGLRKAFGGHTVLDGLSLDLHAGEVVLLRGDNGSGKTTLLNILTGNLEPDAGVLELNADGTRERFRFPRRWWEALNPLDHFTPERVAGERIGRTWQDIRLFATMDLSGNIAVATPGQLGENPVWAVLRRRAVRLQEAANLCAARGLLAELGLDGREASHADHVSLGQSKRVAIARAVRAGAQVLFLDEPLAGLDPSGIGQVLDLLERLAKERQITLVIVEHVFHIPRLLDRATTVWTLSRGQVLVQSPAEVRRELASLGGDGTRKWLAALAGPRGEIRDQVLPGGATLTTVVPAGQERGRAVLEAEGVFVRRGSRLVIGREGGEGLSLALCEGELAVLQAPNGWGKTTLLATMAGLLPISAGVLKLYGRQVQSLPPWERSRLGLSFLQAQDHAFPGLTVAETFRLGGAADVPDYLRRFRNRKMSDLSGGEKQQVALACAAWPGQTKLLLSDEPFSMLDLAAFRRCQAALQPTAGAAVLIALPGSMAA